LAWYGILDRGNFEGRTVLTTRVRQAAAAGEAHLEIDQMAPVLAAARARLLAERLERPQPVRDDKVVAVWNGLAIHALSYAAAVLDRPDFAHAAVRAAEFVRSELRTPAGGLARMWARGSARGFGFLEDYGALARAAIAVYELTFDPKWLDWAAELVDGLLDRFDDGSGPMRRGGAEHGHLVPPDRELMDGGEPSGNALAADALVRLGALGGDTALTDRAADLLAAAMPLMQRAPSATAALLCVAEESAGGLQVVSVVGPAAHEGRTALIEVTRRHLLPGVVVGAAEHPASAGLAALSGDPSAGPVATICRNAACGPPITSPTGLEAALAVPRILTGRAIAPEPDPAWPPAPNGGSAHDVSR
jgi:uncharacterized protein YyaL (SSP411 family)